MKESVRDIGSSFYQLQKDDWEMEVLQKHKENLSTLFSYYYSGRNAIFAILKKISAQQQINMIWLPSYYCDTVTDLITNHFEIVKYYEVNPFEFKESIDVLSFSSKKDVVILNNFWGLSNFQYPENVDRPIIIEDHSHGWLSTESKQSKADYCMCSLRKTYPIPLGAVVWEPNSPDSIDFYENVEDKAIIKALKKITTSINLKRNFIKNNDETVKDEYLLRLNEGENLLSASNNFIKPNKNFVKFIEKHIVLNPNPIKQRHLSYLFKHINKSQNFKIIHRDGFTPFGLLLLFKSDKMFKSFKSFLISNQIYPAHLWPHNQIDAHWKYLFNIHVDFRYDIEDMRYLVEKINVWSKNNV